MATRSRTRFPLPQPSLPCMYRTTIGNANVACDPFDELPVLNDATYVGYTSQNM